MGEPQQAMSQEELMAVLNELRLRLGNLERAVGQLQHAAQPASAERPVPPPAASASAGPDRPLPTSPPVPVAAPRQGDEHRLPAGGTGLEGTDGRVVVLKPAADGQAWPGAGAEAFDRLEPKPAAAAAPAAPAPPPAPQPAPRATVTPPVIPPGPAGPTRQTWPTTVPPPAPSTPPPPASAPAPSPARVPARPQRPRASLEQMLGTRWMLFVGVAVLLLAGLFFFKYAIDRDWISPAIRIFAGFIGGLVMIGVGEWTLLQRKLRLFAAGVMGGGIVLLYFVVYLASPNGWYHLIAAPPAFALMCVVSALGLALSLQTRMLSTSVVSLIGAFATPVLLSTGENRQVLLMCYMLVVNAGFLAAAVLRGWRVLGPLALAGTAGVFLGWYVIHFEASAWAATATFGWLFFAEFVGVTWLAEARGKAGAVWVQAAIAAGGTLLLVLWLGMRPAMPPGWYFSFVLALTAGAMAAATWRNWPGLAAGVALGSTVSLGAGAASAGDHKTLLMCFLLAANALLLVAAGLRRWAGLAGLALMQSVLVVVVWYCHRLHPPAWPAATIFAWLILAEFLAFSIWASVTARLEAAVCETLTFLAGTAVLGLWVALAPATPASWSLGMFVALTAAALALGAWRQWRGLCIGAFTWSLVGLLWHAAAAGDHQTPLLVALLAVNAGLLAVGFLRRWPELAPLALAGAVGAFGLWFAYHFQAEAWGPTNLFAWLTLGEFVAYVCIAAATGQVGAGWGQALLLTAGMAATGLWLAMTDAMPQACLCAGLMVLILAVLAISLWRNWELLALGALAWPAAGLGAQMLLRFAPDMALPGRWALAGWAWAFFAVLTAHVMVRAFWRRRETNEYLHAAVAALAMAGMYSLTYAVLAPTYHDWMGTYTAVLGAAAVAAAWITRRRAGRRPLGYAYLGQGLVLLALAVPVQFNQASIAIAWALQGIAAMFLARRLRNLLLLIYCPTVLALAGMHFILYSLPNDPRLAHVAMVVLGTEVRFSLLLAWGLSATALATAAILRAGTALFREEEERFLAIVMVLAAAGLLSVRTCLELPVTAATWNWLALAAGLAAVGLWRTSGWLIPIGGAAVLMTACKWAVYDTLVLRVVNGPGADLPAVANWQFAAGLAIGAALLAFVAMVRRRSPADWSDQVAGGEGMRIVRTAIGIFAAVLLVYAGSFEIDRYFHGSAAGRWSDPHQAMQTAWSVWWAVYATALMALGFALRIRAVRYLALVIFAVALTKVLAVDMAKVETVYRILSFLCLGTLLVAASWLYHRFFREKAAG